jgi:hypothetical protein
MTSRTRDHSQPWHWPSRLRAAVTAACVAAIVAAAGMVAAYQSRPEIRLGMDRRLPPGVRGFYPAERQGKTGFAWSGGSVRLDFDHVDRRGAWLCRADVINWRSPAAGPARVQVTSDASLLLDRQVGEPTAALEFRLPPDPARSAIGIGIDVSPTFRPGPQDPRDLGLAFDAISCAPAEGFSPRPAWAVLARGAASSAAVGAIIGLAGLPGLPAAGVGAGVAMAQSWSLATGAAAHSLALPPLLVLVSLFGVFCLAPVVVAAGILRRPLSAAARLAIVVSACGLYLKLIFLLQPDKDLVDAVFHAHRLDWVLAGRFYFTQLSTSATPFPYAIGLYVFSAPWALLAGDHVTLLRVVVCASEAVAGALLYPLILRAWGDRAIGVTAVLLFHLLPLPYAVIGNANLTNAFGQSAALVTMIAAVSWAFERRRGAAVLGLTALAALAFLSHVGTLAFLLPTLLILSALFYVAGGRALRKPAISIVAATGLALALAIGLYYGHFGSVYRPHVEKTWAAVTGTASADAAQAKAASGPPQSETERKASPLRLGVRGAVDQTRGSLGWPIIVLALAGAWSLLVRRRVDRLVLGIAAWTIACALFLGWSIVRTVEPRYVQDAWEFIGRVELATSPAAAILAACGAAWLWRLGFVTRVASVALVAAAMRIAAGALAAWIF